jgi:hypothetical protein
VPVSFVVRVSVTGRREIAAADHPIIEVEESPLGIFGQKIFEMRYLRISKIICTKKEERNSFASSLV